MTARQDKRAHGFGVMLSLFVAAGCASTSDGGAGTSVVRNWTPSFMLTGHEKAERNLKDPGSLNLAYGKFQEQTGQAKEARKSYELALRDDPKLVDAVLGLARLDQLADNPKEAEAGLQRALKLKPNDPRVLVTCGEFYASQRRWPEAFRSLNSAIAAAPKEPAYQHKLAIAKAKSGDVNGALEIFTALVGPDKAHYNVAFLLHQEGQNDLAAQQCRLALAKNPAFEPAKAMLQQMQSQQVAGKSHGTNSSGVRSTAYIPQTRNSFDGAESTVLPAGRGVSASNHPVSGANQAAWQSSVRSPAVGTPQNTADSDFDPGPLQNGTTGRF